MKTKVFLLICAIVAICTACSRHEELYKITDRYVDNLSTTYSSYGIFSNERDQTKDNEYIVSPIGRLINVKINHVAKDGEYENLKDDLKRHYKNNIHVRNVYICGGGTVMIDCRN